MKKFIVAFDGLRFSASICDFAVDLAKKSCAHLVGIFLDDRLRHSYKLYEYIGGSTVEEQERKKLDEKDLMMRKQSTAYFEKQAAAAGLTFSTHHDYSLAFQSLVHETIYADLLLIDSTETFTLYNEKAPTEFIRNLLQYTQCPVMLLPHVMEVVTSQVLLYDGHPSSVQALKFFSYLLEVFQPQPTTILTVKNHYADQHVPDNRLMKEFMKRHFAHAEYAVVNGVAEEQIPIYLSRRADKPLVILGSCNRSMVSRWFRPAMSDILIHKFSLPLFVVPAVC